VLNKCVPQCVSLVVGRLTAAQLTGKESRENIRTLDSQGCEWQRRRTALRWRQISMAEGTMQEALDQQSGTNQTGTTPLPVVDYLRTPRSTAHGPYAVLRENPGVAARVAAHGGSTARRDGPRRDGRSPHGEVTGRIAGRVIPWFCLLVVTVTAGRGLQTFAESTLSGVSAVATGIPVASPAIDPAFSKGLRPSVVTIVAYDASTGSRSEERCATTSDRVTVDVLTVDLQLLRDVEAALCQPQ
jgi:hypothetical protein